MKKKHIYMILIPLLPFIIVWTAFVATGAAFNPTEVFQSEPFWTFSMVYWLIFQWIPLAFVADHYENA